MTTIADEWALYRGFVVSPAAGADQVEQLRTAFYAGAIVTNAQLMQRMQLEPDDVACDAVRELGAELKAEGIALAKASLAKVAGSPSTNCTPEGSA